MDRVEEAEETMLQLREQLTEQLGIEPQRISRYRLAGFTKNEAAILDCLDDGSPHGFDELRRVLNATSHRAEGDDPRTVKVTICRLRKKLKQMVVANALPPITIFALHGYGYSMPRASIDALETLALAL
jgi:DNA-binding response OmpR family regulator